MSKSCLTVSTSIMASAIFQHSAICNGYFVTTPKLRLHREMLLQKNLAFSKSCDRGDTKLRLEVALMVRIVSILLLCILWLTTPCFGQAGKTQTNLIPVKPGYE